MIKKIRKTDLNSKRPHHKKMDSAVIIEGVTISGTHRSQVLSKIGHQRKELLHVATVNPEFVMEARVNPRFRHCLTQCYTIADGWGIVWAAQLLGLPHLSRISGGELAEFIVARAAKRSEKVFLLGAGAGVAEAAAKYLSTTYPQLQIAWHSGAQTVALEKNEESSLTIAKINAYEPDYLLVAYGSPWQDIWIEDNRPYLRVRVAVGVGGVLDEWAGVVARCPDWLDQLGGKWAWRLLTQPWRLMRIIRVLKFGFIILIKSLKRLF
jgi:N-acetylglucosaminyldiphosphoundecaprenol N-acetyl-beta-D-mannosaminyltransferase